MQGSSNSTPTVRDLYDECRTQLDLELVAGEEGLSRTISVPKVQKPGLKLVLPKLELEEEKIPILGLTEIEYMGSLAAGSRDRLAEAMTRKNVPCIILSKGLTPPVELVRHCRDNSMPLFRSGKGTGTLIAALNRILAKRLAPFTTKHGLMIDVQGLGILLLGESGIGKSECALDLIMRGAKLVADDVVVIRRIDPSRLVASSPPNIRHLIEVRGLGIINIREMFGSSSVRDEKEIDLVVELKNWARDADYDRLGFEERFYSIMGVEVPYLLIPVSPGRNIATIVEVAARKRLLDATDRTLNKPRLDKPNAGDG